MPLKAKLVYDGGDKIYIPNEMLPANPEKIQERNQLQGTVLEQLCELAGRVCYDSLGAGRSSADYHKHILEVGHLSTIEHAYVHFSLPNYYFGNDGINSIIYVLSSRPGVFVRKSIHNLHITMNLRSILDFDKWSDALGHEHANANNMRDYAYYVGHKKAPQIISPSFNDKNNYDYLNITGPELPLEQYITMFLTGSRGFTHELVRHRFNISQRSTRYCDESESEWVWHPLIEKNEFAYGPKMGFMTKLEEAEVLAKDAYKTTVQDLEFILINNGVDKFTARKQARGAARGVLGNALYTEVIFTASVQAWKWMLELRGTLAADAEIRAVFAQVLSQLQNSKYSESFSNYHLIDSPDGLGSIVEKKLF